jgi:23S rRNA pseudouridine2605 synthase
VSPEGPGGASEGVRLQKFLSRAGVASRRRAEALMAQGRVRVNGKPAVTLGLRVNPDRDRVEVDGRPVTTSPPRWIILDKPRGVITTRKDPGDRPTVYGLLRPEDRSLRYVGRLDRDTEGLLLFTNDGDTAHGLLHPSSEIPREYQAWIVGIPEPRTLRKMEAGVELEDGPARAEAVEVLATFEGKGALLRLVLREGRKREVRRLLEAVGHPVRRLKRVRFGPQTLSKVPRGGWRELTEDEVRALRKAVGRGKRRASG